MKLKTCDCGKKLKWNK